MGLRFNKRVKLSKGLSLNLGKKSAGLRIGTKGLGLSFNTKGNVTKSVGIPGTGLSYRSTSKLSGAGGQAHGGPVGSDAGKTPLTRRTWFIVLMLLFVTPFGIYLAWRRSNWGVPIKIAASAVGAVLFITAVASCGNETVTPNGNTAPTAAVSSSVSNASESAVAPSVSESTPARATSSPSSEAATTSAPPSTSSKAPVEDSRPETLPESAPSVDPSDTDKSVVAVAPTPPASSPAATPESGSRAGDAPEVNAASESPVYASDPQGYMVWIPTKGGTKYHADSTCSNMNGPRQVTLEDAKAAGFGPCGRCKPRS